MESRVRVLEGNLESRVKALESNADKVKGEKGPKGDTGPRGAAGPIDAAVNNSVQAVSKIIYDTINSRIGAIHSELSNELAAKVNQIIEKTLPEFVNGAVANELVSTLIEYKVLDKDGQPSALYFQHEIQAMIDQAVAKALAKVTS